jgi:hypothetical protein
MAIGPSSPKAAYLYTGLEDHVVEMMLFHDVVGARAQTQPETHIHAMCGLVVGSRLSRLQAWHLLLVAMC